MKSSKHLAAQFSKSRFVSKSLFSGVSVAIVGMLLSACGSKTAADPKTVVKSDLNPPAKLVSVTSDQEMILQWTITNTEDDLVGYNVYVAETDLSSLKGKVSAGIFKGLDLSSQQVRRCKDTSDLFSVFGFKADAKQAKESCDDFVDDSKASTESTKSAAAPTNTALADDEKTALGSMVKCKGLDSKGEINSANLSVDISKATDVNGDKVPTDLAKRVGLELSCILPNDTTLSDGKKGFVNGKSYVAFVVAVKGKSAEEISYTSNFVEDSPAKYTAFGYTNLTKKRFLKIALKETDSKITGELVKTQFTDADESACVTLTCGLGDILKDDNNANKALSGLVFSIIGDETAKSERLLLGGSDKIKFLNAKPRNDYAKGSAGPGLQRDGIKEPGDQVLPESAGGKLYESSNLSIVPGSLFYVSIQGENATRNYGKLYFRTVATDYQGEPSNAGSGKRAFEAVLALQPTANSVFAQILARISDPVKSYTVH